MQRLVIATGGIWRRGFEDSTTEKQSVRVWPSLILSICLILVVATACLIIWRYELEQRDRAVQRQLTHVTAAMASSLQSRLEEYRQSFGRVAHADGTLDVASAGQLEATHPGLGPIGRVADGAGNLQWLGGTGNIPRPPQQLGPQGLEALLRARAAGQSLFFGLSDATGAGQLALLQPLPGGEAAVALIHLPSVINAPLQQNGQPGDGVRLTGSGRVLVDWLQPSNPQFRMSERSIGLPGVTLFLTVARSAVSEATPLAATAELLVGCAAAGAAITLILLMLLQPARATAAARASKIRTALTEVIEALPDGVAIMDADDCIVAVNRRLFDVAPSLAAMMGPGRHYGELLGSAMADQVFTAAPGSVDDWLKQRPEADLDAPRLILQQTTDDRWIQICERRLPDGGSIAVHADVSELKVREQELKESEMRAAAARAQLEDAVEALSEGFAFYDSEQRLVLCNSKYREIYWRTSDAIVPGARLGDLLRLGVSRGGYSIPEGEAASFVNRRLAAHRNPAGPLDQKLSDGRWVRISDRLTRDGGLVCVRTDITAMKRAEQAMRTAMEAAERANRAKSRFLAAASHDLRQPLHALGMFVAALRERVTSNEKRRLVDNIGSTLEALEALLNALLDISKLDAGVIEPHIVEVPLAPLLHRLQAECGPQARHKHLELRVVSCTATVRSDPALLESVVRNLLSNALRYTVKGTILLGCRRRGDRIRLEVWDTGVGIPADQLRSIFQEFHRLDNAPPRNSPGVGLGLAIVERTAALLGHRIDVHSVPGRGSGFAIELPLCRRRAIQTEQVEPSELSRGMLVGRSLLVIDDEQAVLDGMRGLLENWGCRVLTAASAEQALDGLERFGRPDLIVADYRLRNGNGIEAIEAVQKRLGASVPAVIVTGDTARGHRDAARAAGYLVLHKPVHPAKLRALLSFSLRKSG